MKKSVDSITIEDLSPEIIKSFLNYLEVERGCTIRTRNQRLAAVYALAKYVAIKSPEHVEWCRMIRTVPIKKSAKKQVTYLEKQEMQLLLDAPDKRTEQGWRDYVLLLYLYNTGARAEEAASLCVNDISKQKSRNGLSIVTITGKGQKTRRCPLWKKTGDAINTLVKVKSGNEPVFLNRLGQQMTRFGVYDPNSTSKRNF